MDTNEYYMVVLGLSILLILTLSYEPPIQEGLDIGKEMRKTFEKPAKDIKKASEKEFKKAKKATTKEFNKAKKETTKGLNVVKKESVKGFNVVKKGAEKAAKQVAKGFDEIFDEVTNIFTYIECGFNKIKTLPDCFFWYFLDIIYGIFYMFYSMLAFAIPPLKDAGKTTWKALKSADNMIYDTAWFRIMRYPKDVMNKCYLCKGAPKKKRR
jgi:membrane-associated HD superfamily phosphohydrolase